jgi:hypothetical protein
MTHVLGKIIQTFFISIYSLSFSLDQRTPIAPYPPIPLASSRKNAKTNTAPFSKVPMIAGIHLFDTSAKMIPRIESPANVQTASTKSASGPLIIKKNTTLKPTIKNDRIAALFIVTPPIILSLHVTSNYFKVFE